MAVPELEPSDPEPIISYGSEGMLSEEALPGVAGTMFHVRAFLFPQECTHLGEEGLS